MAKTLDEKFIVGKFPIFLCFICWDLSSFRNIFLLKHVFSIAQCRYTCVFLISSRMLVFEMTVSFELLKKQSQAFYGNGEFCVCKPKL